MTNYLQSNEQFVHDNFSCPLQDREPGAYERLYREIDEARFEGYDVSIGTSPDLAYDNPHKISEVYDYLQVRDLELAEERRDLIGRRIGGLGVNPWKRSYRRSRKIYEMLEPTRQRLLFGEDEADARAWHDQRGRATALLTIAYAHMLTSAGRIDDGTYPTMSGELDESILEYTFPETAGKFAGMHVSEAIVEAEVCYAGRTVERAESVAVRRMDELGEFLTAPNSQQFIDIVRYCSDSLGIRSRKHEVGQLIENHVIEVAATGERPVRDMLMMSFGCGTALPMLEVLAEIREATGDCPTLLLIDQDPVALAAAAVLAEKMGLKDKIEIHCERLFDRFGSPLKLDDILNGRQIDVAEDSGLREYLPDNIYVKLTKETWKHLRDGGLMTTGNMNENRPQKDFLHGLMGWQPNVQMRKISHGFALHEKAGIEKGKTKAKATRDGVYTIYFTKK